MACLHLFKKTLEARFLSRANRFLVQCEKNGRRIFAYLPNPGRLQELLLPGRCVYLVEGRTSPARKTFYKVVAVVRYGHPVMLDTHRTNQVAKFLLGDKIIPGLEKASIVKQEIQFGKSRIDFLLKENDQKILLEVKSCTLAGQRVAMFPDAVTERGKRHLEELARFSREGTKAIIIFIVHLPHVQFFMPDYHTDLEFSQTFLRLRNLIDFIPISIEWNKDLTLAPKAKLLRIPWDYVEREARDRGSYLLILHLRKAEKIRVGSLGSSVYKPGFYIYVGSAMENLSKRLERHRRLRKRHHWHIDELRAVARFHSALPIRSSEYLECEIAEAFREIAEWNIPGFGSSDCSCKSHLFGMSSDPLKTPAFQELLLYFRMDRGFRNSFDMSPKTMN